MRGSTIYIDLFNWSLSFDIFVDGRRCLTSKDVTDMGLSLKVGSYFSCCSMVHFCDGLFGLSSIDITDAGV